MRRPFLSCEDTIVCPLVPRARTRSSTNRRIAEDKLPPWRALSISATTFVKLACWPCAISFKPLQNASSKLTLVFCPLITIERLMTGDFMSVSPDDLSGFTSIPFHIPKLGNIPKSRELTRGWAPEVAMPHERMSVMLWTLAVLSAIMGLLLILTAQAVPS